VELDAETDRLYGLPLDEFVRERDELAKRLRREGEREAAEEIKRLRKPTAGAWALNQAIRRRRRETDALLAAGERLRAAHESLLSGGDPAALREAMREERALASELADSAEAIASETGKSGPALRERVRATLHAATVDDEAREELAKGRVVREREAVGLGPFGAGAALAAGAPAAGSAPAAAPPKRGGRTRKGTAPARAKRSAGTRDDAAAREEAAARERAERLAAAEGALAEAQGALEEAESAHSEASAELQAARETLQAAEAAEREARDEARELRREAVKRERELERLRARKR
jgi:hypothetical protein